MSPLASSLITVVIPCGFCKLDAPAPARELYTSKNFRNTLAAAEAVVAGEAPGSRVLILSALHGLVELDKVLAPYDVRMGAGDPAEIPTEEIARQLVELGVEGTEVFALLPAAYFAKLDEAARLGDLAIYPQDVYEADAGVGYQRGTVKAVRTSYAA